MIRKVSLLFFAIIGLILGAIAQTSKDYAVLATASVNKNPDVITLNWESSTKNISGFKIYRKNIDEKSWGLIRVSLDSSARSWSDSSVIQGKLYEYQIQKLNGNILVGVSYLYSGIEVTAVHNRGTLLLLTENVLYDSLSEEIANFCEILAADGWKVYHSKVSKSDSIQTVKREIKRVHALSGGLSSLLLIGHVPVPYSGSFGQDPYYSVPPDGHAPDHNGAWPADCYYAIDYEFWNDGSTIETGVSRAANKNYPNDSKWDNIEIPAEVNYMMGRVDLSDLPAFGKSEAELTRNYLRKDINYRTGVTKTVDKGVIDENFSASIGAFASTGWRNFTAMFGLQNVIESDYLSTCRNENLLFGYGAGAGSYTSCANVAKTDSFANTKGAIFNLLFGSYFGDWDNRNNILRAPLASEENGLTNAWSGRPWWQNHPMAMGEPIGYCARLTQNNKGRGQGLYADNVFGGITTIALMGDPTLRLKVVDPASNLKVVAMSNNTKADLSWTASTDQDVTGYYIYRSADSLSNNYPINKTPVSGTQFTDNTPYQGNNYYLVKAVKLTTTASGSYFNLSQGVQGKIYNMTGVPAAIQKNNTKAWLMYPNPVKEILYIEGSANTQLDQIQILNSVGAIVKEIGNAELIHQNTFAINMNDLPVGIYFIRTNQGTRRIQKF
ncbi:MAG: T9SS type A sorting domain-containing protein [Flavobacteriales bacterium]|nr:T9SS type A sorting domain-containing protein [Flavobacteriales bacterium]